MLNNENESDKGVKRNRILFYAAAGATISLLCWFTLAFFRKELEMYDVSSGITSVGLGIISSYVAHNKAVRKRCPGMKEKPGEWIFAIVLLWALAVWTLYQIQLLPKVWGIELIVPQQFYIFLGSVTGIFGISSVWDFLLPIKLPSKKEENRSTVIQNKAQDNNPSK